MEYVKVVQELFGDAQKWIMFAVGAVTVFKVAQYIYQYQIGEADEKAHAVKLIRNTLIMGGAGFFLIWFAGEVFSRMDLTSLAK